MDMIKIKLQSLESVKKKESRLLQSQQTLPKAVKIITFELIRYQGYAIKKE